MIKVRNCAPSWADLKIINPKRHADPVAVKDRRHFPYYAGFSSSFAENLLLSLNLHSAATVLDPWNGSGTTTQAARRCGIASIGVDLNPVMVLVAKASQVSASDVSSLVPLAHAVIESVEGRRSSSAVADPLESWFTPKSARAIRQIDEEINRALISHERYVRLDEATALKDVSAIASFFYVALFRSVRRHAQRFSSSNPTWTRRPGIASRSRLDQATLFRTFLDEVAALARCIPQNPGIFQDDVRQAEIHLGNAEVLPIMDGAADAVITSPPYCTRIDYAVATSVELAVLRVEERGFDLLRRSLTGTSTVERVSGEIDPRWGPKCVTFLHDVYSHESRASKTYYYKNHLQYFRSIHRSLGEVSRVLAHGSPCVLVVQNSYYKEKFNDVAGIVSEMGEGLKLSLQRREDFSSGRSMVGMNSNAKKYLTSRANVESVLCFQRK